MLEQQAPVTGGQGLLEHVVPFPWYEPPVCAQRDAATPFVQPPVDEQQAPAGHGFLAHDVPSPMYTPPVMVQTPGVRSLHVVPLQQAPNGQGLVAQVVLSPM